jgi:hypothetical protein
MIVCIHSNAGYANEKNARSRAGGHFFLSNNDQHPTNNGAIMTNATIINAVMSSAAEAELGALFLNAKEGVYLRPPEAEREVIFSYQTMINTPPITVPL